MTALLSVAVYSFNRGPWLANCVASVRRNLPFAALTVFDDSSDEAGTRAVLADLAAQGVAVAVPDGARGARHGGLYANMQAALAGCGTRLILNLQDDAQVVRPVAPGDLQAVAGHMDRTGAAFCGVLFAQGRRARAAARRAVPVPDAPFHIQGNSSLRAPRPLAYRDVALADAARLRRDGWTYAGAEAANARAARAAYGAMPMMDAPFAAFVPEVPTFRARGRTLAARLAERLLGRAVKPFADMTPAEAARLGSAGRGPALASAWLRPLDPRVRPPFEPNAVDVFAALRWLERAETALRRR